MNKMSTAKEFLEENCDTQGNEAIGEFWADYVTPDILIKFAKLHVQAAIEAANNNAMLKVINNEEYRKTEEGEDLLDMYENGSDTIVISQNSILTAYPLTNIK